MQRQVSFKIFTRGGELICVVEAKIGRCGKWKIRLRGWVKPDCRGFNARLVDFSDLQQRP